MNNGKGIFSSPNTTWAAILAFIALLATQIGYVFDSDPVTTFDIGLLASNIFAIVGLLFARDNGKTSEDVGVKKEAKKAVPPPSNATGYKAGFTNDKNKFRPPGQRRN